MVGVIAEVIGSERLFELMPRNLHLVVRGSCEGGHVARLSGANGFDCWSKETYRGWSGALGKDFMWRDDHGTNMYTCNLHSPYMCF